MCVLVVHWAAANKGGGSPHRGHSQPEALNEVIDLTYTNSINDCNTSLGEDAMNRVSTNGLFVAFFF
ncbi:MAG: hypothetical protein V7K92_28875 [Nostoc sp.]|uniref:hypothetical protein n=1 Tax=Nostoc sp. TaxID=1180 RepID=UPI002FF1466E